MMSRKSRALIPVTILAVASLAGCAGLIGAAASGANTTLGKPAFYSQQEQPPTNIKMIVAFKIHTNKTPIDFHMTLELWKFRRIAGVTKAASASWNIKDLPAPGKSKTIGIKTDCATGRYYGEWTISGITAPSAKYPHGEYQHWVLYYPYNPGSKRHPVEKGTEPPDRAQSWKQDCKGT